MPSICIMDFVNISFSLAQWGKRYYQLLLVDREFFTTGIISTIKQKHLKFLMPAKKTLGIKDTIIQYVNRNRESIPPQYTIKSAQGRHVESFTLIILPNKNTRKKIKRN